MEISLKELKFNKNGIEYDDGYRIVYFYENHYSIGEYCKTIQGFMIGFTECDPMMDEFEIPEFRSVDDLLDRYLNEMKDVLEVALYKIDGTCIKKKQKTNNRIQL